MTCPNCKSSNHKVHASRPVLWNNILVQRRRRLCLTCKHRWFTLELREDSLDTHVSSKITHIPRKDMQRVQMEVRGYEIDGGDYDPEYPDMAPLKIKHYWED